MSLLHDIVVKNHKDVRYTPRDINVMLNSSYPINDYDDRIVKTLTIQCSVELSKNIELTNEIVELSKKRLVSFVYRDVNKELYDLKEELHLLYYQLIASKDCYMYEELLRNIFDKLKSIDEITHGEK